jgi:serine/threonine protein kinase
MSVDPFSRYELLARLGQGGMGVVHRARDRETGRDVAVKISEAPVDNATAERQLREARHSMSVKNRHICSVLAAGHTPEGNTYLVMDLVDGPSLVDVARRRRLPPSLWLEALRALAEALTAVHAQHIIHRDVKPQNVMFDARGVLKLLDFGIARSSLDDTVTGTGEIIGTAAYMSPEQARAETLDGRSDLFSAALTIATFASRGASRFAYTKLDIGQKVGAQAIGCRRR